MKKRKWRPDAVIRVVFTVVHPGVAGVIIQIISLRHQLRFPNPP